MEDACAERVIRTIKEEEVYLADYEDLADAYQRSAFTPPWATRCLRSLRQPAGRNTQRATQAVVT